MTPTPGLDSHADPYDPEQAGHNEVGGHSFTMSVVDEETGLKMENAGYVFAAFTIVWVVVFGYVLSLFSRQRRLRQEINSLNEALKERQIEQ